MIDFWKTFTDTGSIENYLNYKSSEEEDAEPLEDWMYEQ